MHSGISDSKLPFLSDIICMVIWDSLEVSLGLTRILSWCSDILLSMKCHAFPLGRFAPGDFSSGLNVLLEGLLGEPLRIDRNEWTPLLLPSVLLMYISLKPKEVFRRMSILILLICAKFEPLEITGLHLLLLLKREHVVPFEILT